MEEREEKGLVTVSAAGDVHVTYDKPFARLPLIEITVNSDTPAFPYWINQTIHGFDISVYDAGGNRVTPPTIYRSTGV